MEANVAHDAVHSANSTSLAAPGIVESTVDGIESTIETFHPVLENIEIFVTVVESLSEVR